MFLFLYTNENFKMQFSMGMLVFVYICHFNNLIGEKKKISLHLFMLKLIFRVQYIFWIKDVCLNIVLLFSKKEAVNLILLPLISSKSSFLRKVSISFSSWFLFSFLVHWGSTDVSWSKVILHQWPRKNHLLSNTVPVFLA